MNEESIDVRESSCCVVGGGPCGVMLALLLARRGVAVALLEAHHDFDRDFRGDTVHPSTLEILDQIGLADSLHEIPHGKLRALNIHTSAGIQKFVDLGRLRTRFPYITMMPQSRLLNFLVERAKQYNGFRLVLGANVQRLVLDDGVVKGVRYQAEDGWHEVRAPLTVACDGRFSKLRAVAGLEPIKTAPPMDVVWFRLPRKAGDPCDQGELYIGGGHFVVLLDRDTDWQIGYIIVKGDFGHVRGQGIESLRKSLADLVPWLGDRVDQLTDWHQAAVLSVESSCLQKWHQPGLLLLGDAAHVMSPVGGVGINYAIQDSVEAANVLWEKLKTGSVTEEDLARVQALREGPTKTIQKLQGFIQRHIVAAALAKRAFRLPWYLRLMLKIPIVRDIPAKMIAFGPRRVRVVE